MRIPQILPVRRRAISFAEATHRFRFERNSETGKFAVYKEDEVLSENSDLKASMDLLASKIRLTVAEFAKRVIFLHAGVVGFNNRAVIIPGKSFAGKTTLVAEFAKKGCEYFSDEYALIDRRGMAHPFPKTLSLRGIVDDYTQVDFEVEKLGGRRAVKPSPVGCILVAEYRKKSKSRLSEASPGAGLMASIANSISIRQNPKFVIEVLNRAVRQSVVLKAERGEASDFVEKFFEYFNSGAKIDEVWCSGKYGGL
ncbi:MAG: hypothetical protein ACR2N3_05125 [Pyrinomonadaceae bacterium]